MRCFLLCLSAVMLLDEGRLLAEEKSSKPPTVHIQPFTVTRNVMRRLRFLNDGRRIAVASVKSLEIWDSVTTKKITEIPLGIDVVGVEVATQTDRILVSAALPPKQGVEPGSTEAQARHDARIVRIYDLTKDTLTLVHSLEIAEAPRFEIAPAGEYFATFEPLRIYDVSGKKWVSELSDKTYHGHVTFLTAGRLLRFDTAGKQLQLVSMKDGTVLKNYPLQLKTPMLRWQLIAASADESHAAVVIGQDLTILNLKTGRTTGTASLKDPFNDTIDDRMYANRTLRLVGSGDETLIVASSYRAGIRLFDLLGRMRAVLYWSPAKDYEKISYNYDVTCTRRMPLKIALISTLVLGGIEEPDDQARDAAILSWPHYSRALNMLGREKPAAAFLT